MKVVNVEGMMCKNCKKHVEEALEKLNIDFEVSLEEKKAYIKSEIEDDRVIKAIEDAGYEAYL